MLLIIMRLSYQVESSRLSNFVEDKSISKISHFIEKRPAAKDSPPRWLELGIAADYSVVDFHGIRVQQYILALLNIVSNTKRNSVIILRYRIPPPTYVRKQPGNIGQSYAYLCIFKVRYLLSNISIVYSDGSSVFSVYTVQSLHVSFKKFSE